MKKFIVITLMLLGFGSQMYAQNSYSGIKGGLNLASLSADGNSDKNLKMGFHAGVFTKIPLSESLAIQPELLYSGKGIKLNFDESMVADGEAKFNLHYIDLPVKLVFNLAEDFSFEVGPYVSYLMSANVDTDGEVFGADFTSEDELDRDHFNSIDYGFSAGLGFDLDPMIVGFNYNLGLKQVANSNDVAEDLIGDAKNMVIQAYVGFKF